MRYFKSLIPFLILALFFVPAYLAAPAATVTLPLDCRKSGIQAGIPVRRNSDGKITKVDVCAAADSPIDTFRDIPYQAQCEDFPTGRICY